MGRAWRGAAAGVLVLAALVFIAPTATAQEGPPPGCEDGGGDGDYPPAPPPEDCPPPDDPGDPAVEGEVCVDVNGRVLDADACVTVVLGNQIQRPGTGGAQVPQVAGGALPRTGASSTVQLVQLALLLLLAGTAARYWRRRRLAALRFSA